MSMAKLKTKIKPTYFTITAQIYLINIEPTSFRPVSAPNRLGYAAVRLQEIKREREISIDRERERERLRERDIKREREREIERYRYI